MLHARYTRLRGRVYEVYEIKDNSFLLRKVFDKESYRSEKNCCYSIVVFFCLQKRKIRLLNHKYFTKDLKTPISNQLTKTNFHLTEGLFVIFSYVK